MNKERIEKEAKEFAGSVYKRNHFPVHWDKAFRGYIAGATAEHERMAEALKELIPLTELMRIELFRRGVIIEEAKATIDKARKLIES